jgi:hypothetical protein
MIFAGNKMFSRVVIGQAKRTQVTTKIVSSDSKVEIKTSLFRVASDPSSLKEKLSKNWVTYLNVKEFLVKLWIFRKIVLWC